MEDLLGITVLAAPAPAPTPPPATPPTGGAPTADLVIMPSVPDLLQSVVSEVSATPGGAHLLSLFEGHQAEVEALIHHHRRMTVAWHRNAGPSMSELHEFVIRRDVALPPQIDGLSTSACLENILEALRQHGSRKLAADVDQFGHEVLQLSSTTYTGMLERLAARDVV